MKLIVKEKRKAIIFILLGERWQTGPIEHKII